MPSPRRIGFAWGFAEGLAFFLVPDIFISAAALFSLRAATEAWFASIAGSAVAVAVIYLIMVPFGQDYVAFLDMVPGISPRMLAQVGGALATDGLPYTPLLVVAGVPLKAYAGVAFSLGLQLGAVLLWTIFARLVRIAPTVAAFALVRHLWARRIDARPLAWCASLGVGWVVLYAFYFLRMSRM